MKLGIKITFVFAIGLLSCSYQTMQINLVPGLGVIINEDTIFLDKSSPIDLIKFTHLKDTFDFHYVQWDGFDSDGNSIYGSYVKKNIPFNCMTFEFNGPKEDSLSLKAIYIDLMNLSSQILLSEKIITDTSISIINEFPNSLRTDILSENSSEHGVTFLLDSSTTQIKIEKISIHKK